MTKINKQKDHRPLFAQPCNNNSQVQLLYHSRCHSWSLIASFNTISYPSLCTCSGVFLLKLVTNSWITSMVELYSVIECLVNAFSIVPRLHSYFNHFLECKHCNLL